jgi:DNA repair exonuclease SbcCD ATPase subunit
MSWWHPTLNALAEQLSNGVLNEMKRRIQGSNIRREKLELKEDSKRMTDFFQREIQRHAKRKEKLKQKSERINNIQLQLEQIKHQLREKEKSFNQKEKEYKKIIEQQMKYLDALKSRLGLRKRSLRPSPP